MVEQGQLLFRLSSPELDYNIEIVARRLENLQAIRNSSQASPDLAKKRVTIDSEIDRVRKELSGFEKIREQLHVKAPFSGQMKDMNPALHAGQWVSKDFLLGLLADDSSRVFSGYVREQDAARLPEDSAGTFYSELSPLRTFRAAVKEIDKTASYEIYWRELSSLYGGSIPSEKDSSGHVRPLPRYTIYAVRFDPVQGTANGPMPDFAARGTIHIRGTEETFAKLLFKKAVSAFHREGSF
jgi:putative peptide zinc metalloprotease protein